MPPEAERRKTGSELFFDLLDLLIKKADEGERAFISELVKVYEGISASRPSSMAALNAIRDISLYLLDKGVEGLVDFLKKYKEKYDQALWKVAEYASRRVVNGDVLMTNSNSLAIRRLFHIVAANKVDVEVYVCESRPGAEGIYLAEYLDSLGIKVNLIVDSAARFFMKNVNKVFVGAEAVAANGAIVGKVGTSILAMDAKEARARFFVLAPLQKFSYETIYGELLSLPEGDWRMLMSEEERAQLPERYTARVPIYDVTPPEYIDAIVTEIGLFAPQAVPIVLKEIYGAYPPKITPLPQLIEQLRARLSSL